MNLHKTLVFDVKNLSFLLYSHVSCRCDREPDFCLMSLLYCCESISPFDNDMNIRTRKNVNGFALRGSISADSC